MANGHVTGHWMNILRTSEWHGNRHKVKYEWTPKYAASFYKIPPCSWDIPYRSLMGGGMLFQHWVAAYLKQLLTAAVLCLAVNKGLRITSTTTAFNLRLDTLQQRMDNLEQRCGREDSSRISQLETAIEKLKLEVNERDQELWIMISKF
ncbi:unnamed protein product, partial [Iphiclides podalirius]